jgi:hypothetical protein
LFSFGRISAPSRTRSPRKTKNGKLLLLDLVKFWFSRALLTYKFLKFLQAYEVSDLGGFSGETILARWLRPKAMLLPLRLCGDCLSLFFRFGFFG